jgi:hypothetical protein
MTIYESRKKELAQAFGDSSKCITENSWFIATFADLQNQFRIYTDDMEFMRSIPDYCIAEEVPTKQGVIINAGNLKADVRVNGVVIGKTDAIIDMTPGAYSATLIKDGYENYQLAFDVVAGRYNEKYATLVKLATPATPATPDNTPEEPGVRIPTSGPNVLPTGNQKVPSDVETGSEEWFGWEFKNHGDVTWYGKVGVKLRSFDDSGTKVDEFEYIGDDAIVQNVKPNETKYLWVKCVVPTDFDEAAEVKMAALLTRK